MRNSADSRISFGCSLDHFGDRSLLDLVLVQELLEHRRLENAEPDPQADADQDDRQRERNAPAPHGELVARPGAEAKHRQIRQEQSGRHAELRPRGDQPALAVGARPFHRQQHRPAPFAADADALQRPQHGENHRAPDADRVVGRHEGDEKSRDAHAQKRRDQGRLAADAVAVMAEDRGADRPRDEADEVGAEGEQRRRQRILVGEVELAEDEARGRAVEKEVVPLDRGADRRGDHGFAQLRAMFGIGQRPIRRGGHRHGIPPNQFPRSSGAGFSGPVSLTRGYCSRVPMAIDASAAAVFPPRYAGARCTYSPALLAAITVTGVSR